MFDREMWRIFPADTRQVFAGVIDNTVVVIDKDGGEHEVLIVVPSALFHYLYTFCRITPEVMSSSEPQLFLCWDVNAYWFCVSFSEESGIPAIDLWSYTKLPGWAECR